MNKRQQQTLPGITGDQPRETIVEGIRLAEFLAYHRRRGWTIHSVSMERGHVSRWRVLVSNQPKQNA